eukprot:TRINITY_DN14553_c0_g3_i1.p1 TRINITY_DN14553_c0_g3~~TRINITY_DN14553_c0_g3_i1.p1  ORF type:complete len:551 (+),score=133.81 TRINITY_DN14553_c0_g3_i1:108-1760(+)
MAQATSDYIISFIVGVFVLGLIGAFGVTGLKNNKLVYIAALLLLSPLPNVAFAYFLSYFIDDPAAARGLLVVINFLLGTIPYVTNIIFVLLEYFTASAILTYTCSIFPAFAMLSGLFNLSYASDDASIAELFSLTPIQPFPGASGSLVSPGTVLLLMSLSFPLWAVLVYLMEKYYQHGLGACVVKCWKALRREANTPAFEPLAIEQEDVQEDTDVQAERDLVLSLQMADGKTVDVMKQSPPPVLVVDGIRKVYPPRGKTDSHTAVHGAYLSVAEGECFGLLGPNGAGKTSLAKVLTGDTLASAGSAYTQSGGRYYSVANSIDEIYKVLGYCPQFDALWDELTAREHLNLFAAVKGASVEAVEAVIKMMGLTMYADRCAGTYSGGNKRKLSVAIALFSNPNLVYLDEPSTGMDPAAKRGMWDLISGTMSDRAVVLTTHSMEEADVLCQRIAIMVNGKLGCLGSSQHLKSLYGKDYVLEVSLQTSASATAGAKLEQYVLEKICPKASLTDKPYGELRSYSMPAESFDLAEAFDLMERRKGELQVENLSLIHI